MGPKRKNLIPNERETMVADKPKKRSRKGSSPTETKDNIAEERARVFNSLFDRWEDAGPSPNDHLTGVRVDSLESQVGYSSLFRQMHMAFVRTVAYYRSPIGGSLSVAEARDRAFHACTNEEEAKKMFHKLMEVPLEQLNFVDLMELQAEAPRVAEQFWEFVKREGTKEFESGHLSAKIAFPVGYMKSLWNTARFLGVRESFISEWKPSGGIEISLIDMLTQAYFQWQFWVEQTVTRSQTREREEHPDYSEFKLRKQAEYRANGWMDGYWFRPYVSEIEALEHAVRMADRWNRIYMRTLRQLRDLRRYAPVTINNPNQVNIATDGGQQVNQISKNK